MRSIRTNGIVTVDMVDSNGKVECMVHQSSSWYGGIRININHVYILARVQIPERLKRELSTFFAKIERTIIVEKEMLGLKISEGKKISLERYEILARTIF